MPKKQTKIPLSANDDRAFVSLLGQSGRKLAVKRNLVRGRTCLAAFVLTLVPFGLGVVLPAWAQPVSTILGPMPAALETRFALSALPVKLRPAATVYILEPKSGYRLARKGTSGLECLVQRTAWELADYRDDIYYAICYDAAGAATYLKVIRDAARMRAQGMPAIELKTKIAKLYSNGTYRAPTKPGLSYMVAPIMRTIGPPDLEVRTMAMPHLMFYAPGVTNVEIGAVPDLSDPASLMNPFIDRQGNDPQSYMIQMVGEAEKSRIMVEQKALTDDLCAYRDVLCLQRVHH